MSETKNHPWSRDVRRDEAVRAAEDAAAAERTPLPDHRDLPQAVMELSQKVSDLEHQAEVDRRVDAGCHYQVLDRLLALEQGDDLPAFAALRERVERLEQCATAGLLDGLGDSLPRPESAPMPPSPATRPGETTAKRPVPPADGLRTERVTLEVTFCRGVKQVSASSWDWFQIVHDGHGLQDLESVRVVEETHFDDLANVAAERDAALRERDAAREECGTLKARVAELEQQIKLDDRWAAFTPAANAGGVAIQEPVLHGVLWADRARIESHEVRDTCEQAARLAGTDGTVVPLYAAPQRPRGWLTAREREEVQWAADAAYDKQHPAEDTLRALLARSTPPRVKVPRGNSDLRTVRRDNDWIAAIRAAGGEVE